MTSGQDGGTLGYMAPEVLKKEKHSYQSDYFAVGIMMYEFLTGARPYSGKDRHDFKISMSQEVLIDKNAVDLSRFPA